MASPPTARIRGPGRRIVVAYDGSDSSARATQFALQEWTAGGGEVWIVHANEVPPTVAEPRTDEEQGTESEAIEQGMRAIQSTADASGRQVHVWVREGKAAAVILAASAEVDATLIVVGTRGLRGASRLLLGSVSMEVLVHSQRPVVVVP